MGVGASSIAVSDNFAYTMGNIDDEDIIYCLNSNTGEKVWSYAYESPFTKRDLKVALPARPPSMATGCIQ